MDELRRAAGSKWNPKVVEVAVKALQEERSTAAVSPTPVAAGA
jgi:HD-GYP domain-containing protein (c-di-GMP phosphodiesterase class II)